MQLEFSVPKNYNKISQRILRMLDNATKKALKQYADDLVEMVQEKIEEMGNVDTGAMKKGVRTEIRKQANKYVLEMVNRQKYMNILNAGVQRGFYPPISPIRQWAKRKLNIVDDREVFAIQRSIFQKGIKKYPYLDMVWKQERQVASIKITNYIEQHLF